LEIKPGIFDDEITHLTGTINHMAEKIRGREEMLRSQVERLTIQVDEAKRQRAVEDVVATDFFRDLQAKARDMRMRREEKQTGE
jgi:hypothetical protein